MNYLSGALLLPLLTACAPTLKDVRESKVVIAGTFTSEYQALAACSIKSFENEIGLLQFRLVNDPSTRTASVAAMLPTWGATRASFEMTFQQIGPSSVLVEARASRWQDSGVRELAWPLVERCAQADAAKSP